MTKPTRNINLVVLHCSATPSGKPLTSGTPGTAQYLRAPDIINAWHAQRGFARNPDAAKAYSPQWGAIGYHYIIDLDGTVWNGRSLDEVGAHAAGFNTSSVGICLVGGIEREGRYTSAQWTQLASTVVMLSAWCNVPLQSPVRVAEAGQPAGYRMSGGICGHRDLSPDADHDGRITGRDWLKTCPGFDVAAWLAAGMHPSPAQIIEEPSHA